MRRLADALQGFQPSDEAVRVAVRGILDRKDARELIDATSRRHAFFSTMTMTLVRKSKESNVFPRHALDWLRQADRHEYRIVIWTRSSVASFETVAVRSHYHREIEGGNAIPVPDLDLVLRTIEESVADCLEPVAASTPLRLRLLGHEWIEFA